VRLALATVLAVALCGAGWASTYTVRNTADTGYGSLRWAINKANTRLGPDTIEFRPALAGKTIRPATALPYITDARTRINGDINGDGKPDIRLNGADLTSGAGLHVSQANRCTIEGLAIVRFPFGGIVIGESDHCIVRSCHVGANLPGTGVDRNVGDQVQVYKSNSVIVGGTSATARNVIASGAEGTGQSGVLIQGGTGVTVQGNYVGLQADGTDWLDKGYNGISVKKEAGVGSGHLIGGETAGAGNFIVGTMFGVRLHDVSGCSVQGNRFGLAANGSTVIKRDYSAALVVESGSQNNLIGGTSAGARNVIAGHVTGVSISGAGTQGNRIFGNYLGLNVAGTKQRYLVYGVSLYSDAGANKIGGASAATGNHVCPRGSDTTGVSAMDGSGSGTSVRNNKFGIMPNGTLARLGSCALRAHDAYVKFTDNAVGGGNPGIYATGAAGRVDAYRNTFRTCTTAVLASDDAELRLGNLRNTSTTDDGGNVFQRNNTWYISNNTPSRVSAEGNLFGTKVRAEIDGKIYDKLDNPSYGRVDFDPLAGGVHPTGAGGTLAVSGLAAVPTAAGGAEIVFSLAAEADVSVRTLNIAGRPIANVVRDQACQPGTQRILWSGQTTNGTPAPNGTYLVEVTAKAEDGSQARALGQVTIRR
jgi:hypothetical protein